MASPAGKPSTPIAITNPNRVTGATFPISNPAEQNPRSRMRKLGNIAPVTGFSRIENHVWNCHVPKVSRPHQHYSFVAWVSDDEKAMRRVGSRDRPRATVVLEKREIKSLCVPTVNHSAVRRQLVLIRTVGLRDSLAKVVNCKWPQKSSMKQLSCVRRSEQIISRSRAVI